MATDFKIKHCCHFGAADKTLAEHRTNLVRAVRRTIASRHGLTRLLTSVSFDFLSVISD
jgi:hypothetical protein